jgi:hypothetical protein
VNQEQDGNRARLTLAAAALVVVLAVAALLMPSRPVRTGVVPLLVYDPSGASARTELVHEPLARVLSEVLDQPVTARVFNRAAPLLEAAATGEAFVFAPDGLVLKLDRARFGALAAVRRPPPRNLRPRGVLVHRRDDAVPVAPWRFAAERTVLGDSLCLTAVGGWEIDGSAPVPERLPDSGPDPFDHGPALHALRLGCYDYALVRQWDAERFLSTGLLDPEIWTTTAVTPPLPDLVLVAPRSLAAGRRLLLGETLVRLGRESDAEPADAQLLVSGLGSLQLAGFNLLMEADLDRLRRRWRGDWPRRPE